MNKVNWVCLSGQFLGDCCMHLEYKIDISVLLTLWTSLLLGILANIEEKEEVLRTARTVYVMHDKQWEYPIVTALMGELDQMRAMASDCLEGTAMPLSVEKHSWQCYAPLAVIVKSYVAFRAGRARSHSLSLYEGLVWRRAQFQYSGPGHWKK